AGTFRPGPTRFPVPDDGAYSKLLVGDLENDRFEDVVVLGTRGSLVYRFAWNAVVSEVTAPGQLRALRAVDGALMDLDFTGKLDLVAVTADTGEAKVLRQFGPLRFEDVGRTSGVPATLRDAASVHMEDWNRDGHPDLVIGRRQGPPLLLEKQRGGPLLSRELAGASSSPQLCVADFDNDLRPDLAAVAGRGLSLRPNLGETREIPVSPPFPEAGIRRLMAHDYDNDGWLDLWAVGPGIRVWRNRGMAGFLETTETLGLGALSGVEVADLLFADFDRDCDSDMLVVVADGPVRYLRNDGGNAHAQVKVHMVGNRSNASGLGCRIEIASGGLRLVRTVRQLPVEVGVGRYRSLDSFLVHWFNWPQGSAEVPVDCEVPLLALELTIQEGSCPYLYAWDGSEFRFVTDILGAAPLGLPVAPGRHVEADPEEWVRIGDERSFPARDGAYEVRITEELREVLYLDEAKLMVVDHRSDTEVHPTDKLLPGGPFPPGTLLTLHRERPLRRAESSDGRDVTDALRATD
ncbi:MAG: VCBS repeat-containing protein, partial [Verrucomicrobiales bacterium]|nr:VCBS repeat-containing protein [Verrucomicrobiales bacterium]